MDMFSSQSLACRGLKQLGPSSVCGQSHLHKTTRLCRLFVMREGILRDEVFLKEICTLHYFNAIYLYIV